MSDFIDFTVSDAELEIKKRARRRLVGAAVLVLLTMIVLPLSLMDSEEPRTVPDMQVSIPEPGEPESPQVAHENDSESANVVIEPDAASSAAESAIDDMTFSLAEPSSPPQESVQAEQPAQPAPEPPAVRPPEESRQKAKPPSRPSAAQKEEAERARVLALLDGKSPPKEAGQVFIQVAAFKSANRAARQVKELKEQGFSAYTEKAGKVTRVRIGPLSRPEGEQLVARLEAKGHKAVLSSR